MWREGSGRLVMEKRPGEERVKNFAKTLEEETYKGYGQVFTCLLSFLLRCLKNCGEEHLPNIEDPMLASCLEDLEEMVKEEKPY
ncbi:hypothetical protein BT69DRAFT_1278866 [Atractiella rhizophila]|nr:hypothetical protein BT69DRAFT_1278866 [Atractiella rhizophila]